MKNFAGGKMDKCVNIDRMFHSAYTSRGYHQNLKTFLVGHALSGP